MSEPRYACVGPDCTTWPAEGLRFSAKGAVCRECYEDSPERGAGGAPLGWADLPPFRPPGSPARQDPAGPRPIGPAADDARSRPAPSEEEAAAPAARDTPSRAPAAAAPPRTPAPAERAATAYFAAPSDPGAFVRRPSRAGAAGRGETHRPATPASADPGEGDAQARPAVATAESARAAAEPAPAPEAAPAAGPVAAPAPAEVLVAVEDLKKHFPIYRGVLRRQVGTVKAVDGISFDIRRGETLGLVGESGCGKSTAGRTILRLYDATEGRILFGGEDIAKFSGDRLRNTRPRMQMIFQDPQASLNPRMTVGSIIAEPLYEHGRARRRQREDRVRELLDAVGLSPEYANRYPHEFSGGQRQRIGIARALALEPDFIVADEPIAALDVSIQAQVVNLMEDLQEKLGLTYLFISHDLSMVRHICDRVAVMYLGKIMELAPRDLLYNRPRHPYTVALLSAVPIPKPEVEATRERIILTGDVPSPSRPPSGCVFRTRCPKAEARCAAEVPAWREIEPGRRIACHFPE